jgi:hypothetical protein
MRTLIMTFITQSLLFSMAWPCVSPANIEGVAFTLGEQLNAQKLIQCGTENVNYLKDGAEPDIGIRYISHYDPRAMVFIGNYGLSYQQNVRVNCMGVVLPLTDSANPTIRIDASVFDFAAAVKAELVWLSSNGIVDIAVETIEKIDSTLHASGNGGVQYWTHAKSVLGYNSWYVKDTLTGLWGSSGLGINGVYAVKGCSVIQPGSGLPPSNLETAAVVPNAPSINRAMRPFAVRRLADGAAIVFFPQKTREDALLTAIDLKGAILFKQRVPAGIRSLYLQRSYAGHYVLSLGGRK